MSKNVTHGKERPLKSFAELAAACACYSDLKTEFRRWSRWARTLKTREEFCASFCAEPVRFVKPDSEHRLKERFADGFLAAYADYACVVLGQPPPQWVLKSKGRRVSEKGSERSVRQEINLRLPTYKGAPRGRPRKDQPNLASFDDRGIAQREFRLPFKPEDERPGYERPRKTAAHKRRVNRKRQRRFREKQRAEKIQEV